MLRDGLENRLAEKQPCEENTQQPWFCGFPTMWCIYTIQTPKPYDVSPARTKSVLLRSTGLL